MGRINVHQEAGQKSRKQSYPSLRLFQQIDQDDKKQEKADKGQKGKIA